MPNQTPDWGMKHSNQNVYIVVGCCSYLFTTAPRQRVPQWVERCTFVICFYSIYTGIQQTDEVVQGKTDTL